MAPPSPKSHNKEGAEGCGGGLGEGLLAEQCPAMGTGILGTLSPPSPLSPVRREYATHGVTAPQAPIPNLAACGCSDSRHVIGLSSPITG